MQSDDVACTLDVCNAESGAWAHIPDNSICGAGMRCDPAGGCVAAGALTGQAFLFGHTDHSGITVSIDGLEGVSTTTDAMGNWALEGLPTGTHDVVYTKAKYITERSEGVAVLPDAANSPEDVELSHGTDLGGVASYGQISVTYSPNKKAVVVTGFAPCFGFCFNGQSPRYWGYILSTPTKPTELYEDSPIFGFPPPNGAPSVTDTHAVWRTYNPMTGYYDTVWSRPLDGGPAVILGTAPPQQTIDFVGTPNQYVILRVARNAPGYTEHKLYVVNVNGSTPMGSPLYTTPDANSGFRTVVSNDTHAILFTYSSVASASLLSRIDLAAGTLAPINTGFAATDSGPFSPISPNRQYLYGNFYQASSNWDRSFLLPISGPAGASLAPDDDGPAFGVKRSDYATALQWFADSSGLVYAASTYRNAANTADLEGQLKVWHVNQPNPANIANAGTYYGSNFPNPSAGIHNGWSVHGKTVVWRVANPAPPTANQATLMVSSAHSNSPVPFPINATGSYLADFVFNDEDPAASYMVFTESVSSGNSQRSKILSVNLASPLLSAPSVVQLGGALATTCAQQFEAVLSDTTYWQLCQDTGVLTGYAKSTSTPGTQTMNVRPGLVALPDADRIAYRRYDNKLYSSPNTGAMTTVTLISSLYDPKYSLRPIGSAVFFKDTGNEFTRASNADGTLIDEPMSMCTRGTLTDVVQAVDPDKTYGWLFGLQCTDENFTDFAVPFTNLP